MDTNQPYTGDCNKGSRRHKAGSGKLNEGEAMYEENGTQYEQNTQQQTAQQPEMNAGATQNAYGYYQYGNNPQSNPYGAQGQNYYGAQQPVKKKSHTGRNIVIGLLVAALVVGLIGGAYIGARRIIGTQLASSFETQRESERDPEKDARRAEMSPKEILEERIMEDESDMNEDNAEKGKSAKSVQLHTSGETQIIVTDVTQVYEAVIPAIVAVDNNYTETYSFWGQTFSEDAMSTASGIIIAESDKELLIATNYHVIENANSLSVHFVNEAEVKAYEKGSDAEIDLAVIAVKLDDIDEETYNAIAIATLGNSDTLQAGEPAIVIGNALGYGQSVTTGVISAPARMIEDQYEMSSGPYIQTDAAINPGNSGGALLNSRGEVIGITVSKLADVRVEGMGYAIPISKAEPIIGDLMNYETREAVSEAERGYLGISGFGITADMAATYDLPRGVYVRDVMDGGAADKAGIIADDVITKVNGKRISSMEELQKELSYYKAGETVTIVVMREIGGELEQLEFSVTLVTASAAGIGED